MTDSSPVPPNPSCPNPFCTASTLPYELPPFAAIGFDHYAEAFEVGMREQLDEVAAITGSPEPATFENTVVALERSGAILSRVSHAFYTLTSAATSEPIQQLQSELAPRLAAHSDAIMLDGELFARIDSLERARLADGLDLDAESAYLLERTHLAHVRAGAGLGVTEQRRLAEINGRLATLGADFGRKLLADTNDSALLVTDAAELDGLSENEMAGAKEAAAARGLDGYLLTLVLPTDQPALGSLRHRDTRARLLAASQARGLRGNDHDTSATVLELVSLRAERAALLGYASHADYILADRTARSYEAVREVLDQVVPPALAMAQQEAAELAAALEEDTGATDFAASDWSYYAERLQAERYSFDTGVLKPYFELHRVVADGVFGAATDLYGITFTERTDLVGYHPENQVFEVHNADGGALGLFVADYYTRDSKKGGAWMNFLVSPSGLLDQQSVVVNNVNLTAPPSGEPTLLSLDEVTTLFHEFGHALHGLFSTARFPSQSGTSVARDFVEYPSQVNEMWITDPATLSRYAVHHETGARLDPQLAEAVRSASMFGQGFDTVSFCAAAWLDLCWHRLSPEEAAAVTSVTDFEHAALAELGLDLPLLPPRYGSAYFNHIFGGGYSAGYYSYLWSEILDADTVEWFVAGEAEERSRRELGDIFRDRLLSRGGSSPELELFEAVRGRPQSITPLLRRRGLLVE